MLRKCGYPCKPEAQLGASKSIRLCHSERSEESQFVLGNQTTRISQRCFAPLNMTKDWLWLRRSSRWVR